MYTKLIEENEAVMYSFLYTWVLIKVLGLSITISVYLLCRYLNKTYGNNRDAKTTLLVLWACLGLGYYTADIMYTPVVGLTGYATKATNWNKEFDNYVESLNKKDVILKKAVKDEEGINYFLEDSTNKEYKVHIKTKETPKELKNIELGTSLEVYYLKDDFFKGTDSENNKIYKKGWHIYKEGVF